MKPKVWKGGRHQSYKWCVGKHKGTAPYNHCKTWQAAINYALWWYCNKNIMKLG